MKMKKFLMKGTNWVLAGIIGLFGFTGCKQDEDLGSMRVEYGTPYAKYTVIGSVADEATGKPIAGIRVGYYPEVWDDDAFGPEPEHYGGGSNAYVKTNTNGRFKLTSTIVLAPNIIPVYIEDIDGEENGSFRSKMVEVNFKYSINDGNSNLLYHGEYTTTKTIKLTEVDFE